MSEDVKHWDTKTRLINSIIRSKKTVEKYIQNVQRKITEKLDLIYYSNVRSKWRAIKINKTWGNLLLTKVAEWIIKERTSERTVIAKGNEMWEGKKSLFYILVNLKRGLSI